MPRLDLLKIAIAVLMPISTVQSQQARAKPSLTPPSLCSSYLVSAATFSGARSYLRLRFELEALTVAQQSDSEFRQALADVKTSETPASAFGSILVAKQQISDYLECAAIVMGRFVPTNKEDSNVQAIAMSAFTRERDADTAMLEYFKQRLLKAGSATTPQEELRRGEQLSNLTLRKKNAGGDLLLATQGSLLLAIDTDDSTAKTVEYMNLSCPERDDLLRAASDFQKTDDTAYEQAASLIKFALDKYKCKP